MPCAAALGEIDALVVVGYAAADNTHLRSLQLAEKNILIRHAGAHRIDHIHAYDHVLRCGPHEEEDRH